MSNINFQNKTAVKVEGYVFYENSSIPVVGATFEVNGQAVVSNGEFVKSDDKGQFAFSVPGRRADRTGGESEPYV